jgi:hypothetical protein
MPSSTHLVIRAGSQNRRALLFARDTRDRLHGVPGLRHDTPGLTAAYLRSGSSDVHRIALSPGRTDWHVAGSFRAVDDALMPGVYELGLPNEALEPGSPRAIVSVSAPGAAIAPVLVTLVAFDPLEPERVGMTCLEWPVRWRFLRRGLPKLTSLELSLRKEAG